MGKELDALIGFILFTLAAGAVIKILDDANKKARYRCPRCGNDVRIYDNPCPYCRAPLQWK